MCGIIGYLGKKNDPQIGLEVLKQLEYRGYDVDKPRNLAKSVTVE